MNEDQKQELLDVEASEESQQGPGVGAWVSGVLWMAMIIGAVWAYCVWRNTLGGE